VYVIDISKSIRKEEQFTLVKSFINNSLDMMNISQTCSRAGVILFARDAWINFTFNAHSDQASITNTIDQIILKEYNKTICNGTNTPAALKLLQTGSQELGLRPNFPHIAILMTVGNRLIHDVHHVSNKDCKHEENRLTKEAADNLKRSRIYNQIYAIGIRQKHKKGTSERFNNTLDVIADPHNLAFFVKGFTSELFHQLTQDISNKFCRRK